MTAPATVTTLLRAWGDGDARALDALVPLVYDELRAQARAVVGGYDVPYPPSRLEEEFLPDLDRVLDAVDRSLAY